MIDVPLLLEWILSDIRIESQLDIEDAELLRLGFTLADASNLTLYQRHRYLQACNLVISWNNMIDRRKDMDVGIMVSGYVDRGPKKEIQVRWQKEAADHIDRLAEFSVETRGRIATPRPIKKRKFVDALKRAGDKLNGKTNDIQ